MRINLRSLLVSSLIGIASAGVLRAQDQPAAAPPTDPAEMEKLWEAFMTPGPEHARFKSLVGEWTTEAKEFMPNPDEPKVTQGKATFNLVLGGRYLRQSLQGEFNGQRFTGLGFSGYDNAAKKYVGTWMDNFGTGILNTTGTYDAKTKAMTETGETSSPFGPMKMKMVTQDVSDDKFVFTMYMALPDGTEQKTMEIMYTRKKSE
jgi:hypothetical protein